jgi:formylglycine-generating enzyme required for sulfatase activity
MSDIFLSYASEDLPRVLPLVRALEDRGWSVWWDRTILPGRTYDIVIEEALEAARCVIVVWSNTSVTSDWVKTEAAEGVRRRILVPVALDAVRIPLEFRRIQAAQLMDWRDTDPHPEFEKVIRSVTGLLGPMSPATSIPSETQPPVLPPPEVSPSRPPEPVPPVSPRAAPTEASQQGERQPTPSLVSHISRPSEQEAPRTLSQKRRRRLVWVMVVVVCVLLPVLYMVILPGSREPAPVPPTSSPTPPSVPTPATPPPQASSTTSQGVREPVLEQRVTNSIGVEFVLIRAGEFQMGAPDGDKDEQPVHTVRISKPFYLGQYEITQAQWQAVMENNPSRFTGDPTRPVENVSWEDVQDFIRRLNAKESGVTYRLPTEAEWEYEARAGTTTAYSFGNDQGQLSQYAWYGATSGSQTQPVGKLRPNAWGLYDMHGNVWEWVQDWYGPYTAAAAVDPAGPSSGSRRVFRGGAWLSAAGGCRSASRYSCQVFAQ